MNGAALAPALTPALAPVWQGVKTLRFPAPWEGRFEAATARQRLGHFIVSALIALLIYNFFAVSDWFIMPDTRRFGLWVRLAVVTPVELVVLGLLWRYRAWFERQAAWMAEALIVASGVVAAASLVVIINHSHSSTHTLAHAGFAPMLVYGNVVQRLRFRWALLLSVLILLIHACLLFTSGSAPSQAVLPVLLLNLVTAFFSLVSNYEMEYEERQRFVLHESERQLILTLDEANQTLDALSRQDALTACANRHHAHDYLREHTLKTPQDLSIILLDVDHFKAFNDRYGHPAGDQCLKSVARAISAAVPTTQGLVARWGGEEFMVMLPAMSLAQARDKAEAIRLAVQGLKLPHAASSCASTVSVSLGVAHAPARSQLGNWFDALQVAADQALYAAKSAGRNAVGTPT